MQPNKMLTPWILSADQFSSAVEASNARSHLFLEEARVDPSMTGPKPLQGHDKPKLGENGWVPDANGRWHGPDEYFITNWQMVGDSPVTPSPHPPCTYDLFCLPPPVILERALKAGYEPDPVSGWRIVTG